MRSLVTILRVPSRNITEEYLLMISLRKLDSGVGEVKVIVFECLMDVLESLNPSEPLLVPKMKSDSECGCSCEQVIFQHFQSLLLLPLDIYFIRKGWPVCSKLHMKAPHSSVANRNYSLRLRLMPLSERQALLGKICFKFTETKDYQDCRCGMASSLPADLTKYLGCFSQTFQSLMVLELEVSSFMYLDCGLSQLMWVMPYPISALLRVSNSRQCD